MANIEDEITPAMDLAMDLFGETVTIQNYTYDGDDPDEGTPTWTEDPTVDVQGRILENQRPMEEGDISTQQVTAEYHAFIPTTATVHDGLQSESVRASVLIDEDGYEYDVIRVTDEHNGLYRCQCSMEAP